MNFSITKLLSLLYLLILPITLSANDSAVQPQKKVMVICSHSETSSWSIDMLKPIIALDNERQDLYFTTSYLRMTSLSSVEELEQRERDLISSVEMPPDLVILVGGSSYLLVDTLRESWPDVPFILAGETDYICPEEYTLGGVADPSVPKQMILPMADEKNLTLIQTPLCIEEEVELARSIYPNLDKLLFIGGENYQSRQQQIVLETYMRTNYPEVDTEILLATEMSTDDLIEEVMSHNNDETAIIYGAWLRHEDYLKNIVTRNNILRLLEGYAPIISLSSVDFTEHPDVVGFCSYNHDEYSREIKERISNILDNGVQARDIPSIKLDDFSSYINKSALEKFGLTVIAVR